MKRSWWNALLALLVGVVPFPAAAGTLSAELESRYQAAGIATELPVIVRFEKKVDISTFNKGRASAPDLIRALRANAAESQAALFASLDSRKRGEATVLWISNSLTLSADHALAERLSTQPGVHNLEYDGKVIHTLGAPASDPSTAATFWNQNIIRATQAWADFGVSGRGIVIGSVDSGFDPTHPALQGKWRGGGNSWRDFVNGNASPYDDHGHGTHTIGTMVGGDGPGPFANDIGVAYGAQFIAAKVLAANGRGSNSDLGQGMQWMLDPDGNPATNDFPDVINNSWANDDHDYSGFHDDVAAWRAVGIIPVFAIGNDGPNGATTSAPGNYDNVIGVGATTAGDGIASFSSRGPSPSGSSFPDDRRKPDLSAPGQGVLSSVPGGGYAAWDGTSMAAPHVAATVALLLEACPSLNYDEIRSLLIDNAADRGTTGYDFNYGYGRLDAYTTVQHAVNAVSVSLSSPANGATCRPRPNGTLQWSSVSGARWYRVQLGTSPTCGSGLLVDNEQTSTTYSYSGLAPSTTYYWRVFVITSNCSLGWSACASFTTSGAAPAGPTALSPADGATNLPTTGLLDWTDAAGATRYDISIRCPAGDVLLSTSVTTSEYSYTLAPGTYSWTVTPRNACLVAGPGTVLRTLTVGIGSLCSIPAIVTPAPGATCQPLTGRLRWTAIPGASGYVVMLDDHPGANHACENGHEYHVTTNEFAYSDLHDDREYRWSVREDCPCAPFSECVTFRTVVDSSRVHAPNLSAPSNGSNAQPADGTLTWNQASEAMGYRVQLGTSCVAGPEIDVTGLSHPYWGLAQNTNYYWRVASRDSCGQLSAYSSCWTFRTAQLTSLNRIYIPGGLAATRGQLGLEVPVRCENLEALSRLEFRVRYDEARFRYAGYSLAGTRGEGAPTVSISAMGSDRIQVSITFTQSGPCVLSLPPGDGVVCRLVMEVLPNAPLGQGEFDPGDSGLQFRRCSGGGLNPTDFPGVITVLDASTGIGDLGSDELPSTVTLLPAVPNPVSRGTTLRFALPVGGEYRLSLYDVAGKEVARLGEGRGEAGWQMLRWDGRSRSAQPLGPGVYWVRLVGPGGTTATRVTLVR